MGGFGGGQNGGFGGGQASSSDSSVLLTINGGNIFVNAGGDGLDSNGNIVMNGGNVTVLGTTSDGDTALDFDGAFTINRGCTYGILVQAECLKHRHRHRTAAVLLQH